MLAVVTGASSGIGKGYAYHLAKQGYDLVLVARRESLLQQLKTDLEISFKVKVEFHILDLSGQSGAVALVSLLGARRVDLFINNAGAARDGAFAELPVDSVLSLVQLLITSVTYLTHELIRHMAQHGGGRIVNVASALGFWPYVPNYALYSAAKQYVLNLSRSVDVENRRLGNKVRVITLVPGVIATEFAARRGGITSETAAPPSAGTPTETFVRETLPSLLTTRKSIVISGKYSRAIQFFNAYYAFAINLRMFMLRQLFKSVARTRRRAH